MDMYNNDPQFQAALNQARTMDVTTYANMVAHETEGSNYNNDDVQEEREETVVEQIFEDFGAPPDEPVQIPTWIQEHQQRVDDLSDAQYKSMHASKDGMINIARPKYHLEKLDHKHRMGDVLVELHPEWARTPCGMGFFEWLDSLSYFEVFARLKALKGETFARTNAPAFMQGVKYLDSVSRRSYQVLLSVKRHCMLYNGKPLSTASLRTAFSGMGWGAWVMSEAGRFYTGPHIKGEFHHSSFVSGGMVRAAGEWKVEDGRLKYITGKTGHYECPIAKLVEALQAIQAKIGLSGANVIVWDRVTKKATEFPAMVFISNPVMQEEYLAIGAKGLHTGPAPQPRMKIGGHREKA